ncbi:hypothetical protein HY419_02350 [candidate division WWE3 bacterium]|nr:hypothetical protein [candidate division WWE3 bacterium]
MGIFDLLFGKGFVGRTTVTREVEARVKDDWLKIDNLMKVGGPSNLRQALMTADRSLDTVLKELYQGNTLGERLKECSAKFDRVLYNKIWEAHKIRNAMVHEAGFEPPYFVTKQAIEDLRRGIQTFGVSI